MKIKTIGQYRDENTGETYTVLKRTKETTHYPVSGNPQPFEGTHDYITSCNIDLNQLDDQLDGHTVRFIAKKNLDNLGFDKG